MRCPGCQTENDPGAKFCTECGQPLPAPAAARPEPRSDAVPAAPATQSEPQPESPVTVTPKKGKSKTVILVIFAVVIVLLCVSFFVKGRSKPKFSGAGRGEGQSAVGASDTAAADAAISTQPTTAQASSDVEPSGVTGPNGAAERDFSNLFGYWCDKTGAWELYATADGRFTLSNPDGLFTGYVERETDGYAMLLPDGSRLNGDAVLSLPEGIDDLLVYRSQFFEVSLDLTHYDGYPATQRTVWIAPPGEQLFQYPSHEEAVIDNSEYATGALLLSDYPVTDLKVLSLELKDVSQDGEITYSERELYSLPVLFPSRPLLMTVTFEGSIPTRGISYVDADGTTRRFTLSLSGEDGTFLLTEF